MKNWGRHSENLQATNKQIETLSKWKEGVSALMFIKGGHPEGVRRELRQRKARHYCEKSSDRRGFCIGRRQGEYFANPTRSYLAKSWLSPTQKNCILRLLFAWQDHCKS